VRLASTFANGGPVNMSQKILNQQPTDAPRWMSHVLIAAAIYNLTWGAWVILRPLDLFCWADAPPPLYPSIWQCVGMIVGVYGIGYAIAARDPFRHWPIVLVGLLGKLLGPLGFVWMLATTSAGAPGRLPTSWAWTLVTNDLIWWIPFASILYHASRHHLAPPPTADLSLADANQTFRDQHGNSIKELSQDQTLLVVFLRHSGCTFCREALADLQQQRERLAAENVLPVLVHMGDDAAGEAFFDNYSLGDVPRISDPACQLYRAYGLTRGKISQLLGPAVWWRGFKAAILARHAVGAAGGDGFQMPGAFLVRNGQILHEYRHTTAADRPDYCELAQAKPAG
jgi:peroxiredoxin